jgi:hypothetical protein
MMPTDTQTHDEWQERRRTGWRARPRSERQVGSFAGFTLFVADSIMTGPEIVIKGAGTYFAKVGNTALGTIRSVEYAVQNLEEVAVSIKQRIAETRKRIADLMTQSEQGFEYEARLVSLVQRQQEIEEALDLTKSQASSRLAADPNEGLENGEPLDPQQNSA